MIEKVPPKSVSRKLGEIIYTVICYAAYVVLLPSSMAGVQIFIGTVRMNCKKIYV